MKRAASPSSNLTKRSKHFDAVEPDILGQVPEQCPTDILEHGVDQAKCIAGKFKMTLPQTGKIEAVVTVHSTTPSGIKGQSFQVFFNLSSSYLAMLDFSPLDEFRLSLKGAELRKVPRVSNTCTLPIQLIFSEHIHISWKKHGPGLKQKVLNTWLSSLSVLLHRFKRLMCLLQYTNLVKQTAIAGTIPKQSNPFTLKYGNLKCLKKSSVLLPPPPRTNQTLKP
ncbi:hypothetical protein GALMADRAFT_616871 [Galerina marginata CBS 339.88]|uniref:Uncharacterized protein n=1 Tax=Galerina marginata (strain CBS 339.88) TaxID=685588 RepID=A0A067T0U7_GALM3|nr:hypothetical protein GALMADRAFT_616871 [Galerina marginata CBS 339.88]